MSCEASVCVLGEDQTFIQFKVDCVKCGLKGVSAEARQRQMPTILRNIVGQAGAYILANISGRTGDIVVLNQTSLAEYSLPPNTLCPGGQELSQDLFELGFPVVYPE
jgi:hypothetical protein